MNGLQSVGSVLIGIALAACASAAVSACGSALPSQAPLSASGAHPMRRTRPSSARAVEPGSDDHPSVESETPPPSDDDDDDDDDDSTGTSTGTSNPPTARGQGTLHLLSQ